MGPNEKNQFEYSITEGVKIVATPPRPIVEFSGGGRVALDRKMVALLQFADGKSFSEIVAGFQVSRSESVFLPTALVCLVESGLLARKSFLQEDAVYPSEEGSEVTVLIVTYDSRRWLDDCLQSLFDQSYRPIDILIVDNASEDGTPEWIEREYPQAQLIKLEKERSYASALNEGISRIRDDLVLILNPDVILARDAVKEMVDVGMEGQSVGAVATKLRLMSTPRFLNGIGNRVSKFSWGLDNGLGHIDLGQFDDWEKVPSACFAATLLKRKVFDKVGPFDENFPMYYEDSEWSYRARRLGFDIRVAPHAVIYHNFGQTSPSNFVNLRPPKLMSVTYGRLRFAMKLLQWKWLWRYMLSYAISDVVLFLISIISGRWSRARAMVRAWRKFLGDLPAIRDERQRIEALSHSNKNDLIELQRGMPEPLIWMGIPELTFELVAAKYFPLIAGGHTRPIPENVLAEPPLDMEPQIHTRTRGDIPSAGMLFRIGLILKYEGIRMLIYRIRKRVQWQLSNP